MKTSRKPRSTKKTALAQESAADKVAAALTDNVAAALAASLPEAKAPPDSVEKNDLEAARRVLETEAEALSDLSKSLGHYPREALNFIRALNFLANAKGRVIVTGMGKSGHIARKIAATMASTGTPALFVHPGEASHGDLGMITREDCVLALSNSGETQELSDIVAYARRFAIPLVAITARAESSLAEAADVALMLPDSAEACPMGLAPTTSTTLMLALGDAISVALLERKGFSADDFHLFHPRGRLGQRFLRVADLMHKGDELPLIAQDGVMSEAILVMTAKRLGCVGVVDDGGRLVGMLTDGDLRRHMSDSLLGRDIASVMTLAPKTIRPGALAAEALGMMNDHKITSLFVVEDDAPSASASASPPASLELQRGEERQRGEKPGRPVGILHIHDCLRAGVA
jgi:arabinose-5-phosphate isomerase